MNLNINNLVVDNCKCERCKNQSICKYVAEFKRVDKAIADIKIEFSSPINTAIRCNQYEKMAERQDGLFAR